jgi:hypothetical protein
MVLLHFLDSYESPTEPLAHYFFVFTEASYVFEAWKKEMVHGV